MGIGGSCCVNRRVNGLPGAVTLTFGDSLSILLSLTGKRHCWLGLVDLNGWQLFGDYLDLGICHWWVRRWSLDNGLGDDFSNLLGCDVGNCHRWLRGRSFDDFFDLGICNSLCKGNRHGDWCLANGDGLVGNFPHIS